jgi:phage terminase large subunit-like protein
MNNRERLEKREAEYIPLKDIEPVIFEEFIAENGIEIEKLSERQKLELAAYKEELEERYQKYGILYYRPQKYQEAFHESKKKIRLVLGGNQTGKTEVGVAEDLRIALGIDPYQKFPAEAYPLKIRVMGNDLTKAIGDVLLPKMLKFVPKSELVGVRHFSGGQVQKLIFRNGSSIEFLSYEQETKSYEGWTGHYVHFDEPPPQDKFVATMRGLMRYNGKCAITATPLSEAWIYDEIFLKGARGDKDIDIFEFSIFDNKYLPKEEVLSFVDMVPESEREARLYGKFKFLTGLVYKEFSEAHRIESFEIPKHWTRICACDFHPRKPCYFVWVAIDENDTAYVYDELNTQGTIEQICERLVAKEKEDGGRVRYRFIDSISSTPDRVNGRCPQREIALCGSKLNHPLVFRASTKAWNLGKNAVSEYLDIKDGKPGIYFFKDKVPYLIESLTRYTWEVPTQKSGDLEKARKIYDDAPDALRYALVLKIKYFDERRLQYEYAGRQDFTGYRLGI